MNRLSQVSGYTYASPRYHAGAFLARAYASEDYGLYDGLNGTYDKFWPLYAVTESEAPSSVMINSAGQEVEIKGDLGMFLWKGSYAARTIGSVGYAHPYANRNLDQVQYSFDLWLQPALNPGWTAIQTYGGESAFAGFIIRLLSTVEIIKENHAVTLEKAEWDDSEVASSTEWPVGMIVQYEDKVYQCIRPNTNYPDLESGDWLSLEASNIVFSADIYVFNQSGTTSYFQTFVDRERTFTPKEDDGSLVSWNISAWYE